MRLELGLRLLVGAESGSPPSEGWWRLAARLLRLRPRPLSSGLLFGVGEGTGCPSGVGVGG